MQKFSSVVAGKESQEILNPQQEMISTQNSKIEGTEVGN